MRKRSRMRRANASRLSFIRRTLQHNFLEEIEGDFMPRRRDDLRDSARPCIGQRVAFYAGWIIEAGPYQGQWAMVPRAPISGLGTWVPRCDLLNVVTTRRGILAQRRK